MKFKSFEELLAYNAQKFKDETAFVFDAGEGKQTLTYEALQYAVSTKAAQYRALERKCFGVLMAPSPLWVIEVFAAVIAGKQTVLLDASAEPTVLQKLIRSTDVDKLVTDNYTAELANALVLQSEPSDVTPADGEGDVLFFTSGTTDFSKAVVLTSRSLLASAWNGQQKLPCRRLDNVLCMLPLTHVFGFVCAMLWPLTQGACVSSGRGLRFLTQDCNYFEPTIISVVPSMLKFLVGTKALNKNLRTILVGAGPAGRDVLAAAKAMGYEIRFGYGLTETSSGVAISCGDDPYAMSVCPDDEITIADDGEILVRCPECIMKGYYKDEASTAEVIDNGIFRTGDLGKFDEAGNLRLTGRKKDILVLENGTKVFLAEWEQELQTAIGADDMALALKENVITLFIGDKDGKIDKSVLNARVAAFNKDKSFDQQIGKLEVRSAPLPRTATGKIRRWAL